MEYAPRHYTARQLLALLERDVILRGRLPLFSELAYRSDGPSVEAYLDLLGEGDWTSLQIGLSAWLTARGYHLDNDGRLNSKSPPLPPPPAARGDSDNPPPALSARDLRAAAERERKKAKPLLKRKPTAFKPIDTTDKDWTKVRTETLLDECQRGIDKRFPPTTNKGQQMIGQKLITAVSGIVDGQAINAVDGRNLVRTLLCLVFPEASLNQLTIHPLFWRDDPIGGLVSLANGVLYPERDLIGVAETVERLGIEYTTLVDLLSRNVMTLVFTRSYALVRAEVASVLEQQLTARGQSGTRSNQESGQT